MSEKLNYEQEFDVSHEAEELSQHVDKLRERVEHEQRHGSKEHVSELQKQAEHHAISHERPSAERAEHHAPSHHRASKDLKDLTFDRTMVRTRKKLNAPEKALSRVIHQPVINAVSEFGARTIARPASLFGGGLLALLGTTTLLYLTRKYGYEFNYLVFLMTFVVGFGLGSLIEMLVKLLKLRSRER